MSDGKLVDRNELVELLGRFKVNYERRTLRYVLTALGIEPAGFRNLEAPKRGRVGLYDPMVAWVVASSSYSQTKMRDLAKAAQPIESLVAWARKLPGAAAIPGLMSDDQLARQLLIMTSPELGMGGERLLELLDADAGLVELSSRGPGFMEKVLSAYKRAWGLYIAKRQLVLGPPALPMSRVERREHYARRWIEEAAPLFPRLDEREVGGDPFGADRPMSGDDDGPGKERGARH